MRIRLHCRVPSLDDDDPTCECLAMDIDLIGEISCLLRPMINVIETDICLSRALSLFSSFLFSSLSPFLRSLSLSLLYCPSRPFPFSPLHSFLVLLFSSPPLSPHDAKLQMPSFIQLVVCIYPGRLALRKLVYSTHQETISRRIQLSSLHSPYRIRQTPNQQETQLA